MPRMLSGPSAETDARNMAAYLAGLCTVAAPPAKTPGTVQARADQAADGAGFLLTLAASPVTRYPAKWC